MTEQKTIPEGADKLANGRERIIQSRYEIVYGTDPRVNLDSLLAFEEVSWEEEERAEESSLLERLESFPEGISMLYDFDPLDGTEKPMAQLTVAPKMIPQNIESFAQMRDLKVDRTSDVLWGTNLGRRKDEIYNGRGYATEIVKDRLNWGIKNGYKKFMAGITCDGLKEAMAGYLKKRKDGLFEEVKISESNPDLAAQEYMSRSMNPTLNTFIRAARELGIEIGISDPIPDYWPENETSLGYGVMMTVDLERGSQCPEEENFEFQFDLNRPQFLGVEPRETLSGPEETMFVYLPAKGCKNNCAFCSIKHIKAYDYNPSKEKSIAFSNSLKVFLKDNKEVQTIKIFNAGNILYGSEFGEGMEMHEYLWDKLPEAIGDLKAREPEAFKIKVVEIEVRIDDLIGNDDPKKQIIQERIINLKNDLNQSGVCLRLILAYEYIDEKVIKSQGKFANAGDYKATIKEALSFLEKNGMESLAYAMFGGRMDDRPMRSTEAVEAALNTIVFAFNQENGPREVIINCQYLDPLQQSTETKAGQQLYVPRREDFIRLILLLTDVLKVGKGKRVRISYQPEEVIIGTKGPELDDKIVNILDQFNSAKNQYEYLLEDFQEIISLTRE